MRKRRMPPPTFALQRLRGASLRSLADKYRVSFKAVHGWQWACLQSPRKYLVPPALCRALAEQALNRPRVDGGLYWFAQQVEQGLYNGAGVTADDVATANRDHAYAMLRAGHITMDSHP